jgi:NAD(P)-dependent dehydrogenase (short-subunit alcohol dehydrogenase family)
MKRVCLLTGASGLLGTAFIERFAEQYQIVAVHHRHPIHFATQDQSFVDPLFPSRDIGANRHAVYALRADITNAREIDGLIDEVIERFGQVDLLINGAAIRAWSPLLFPSGIECAEELFRLNLHAPLCLCVGLAQKVWRANPESNLSYNRNIINVSSTAGLLVYPDLGQALYGSSKAALNHLTYHLASEFWDIGVRVNAIAPDTFPGRVSTNVVLDAIAALDASDETGQIQPLTLAD